MQLMEPIFCLISGINDGKLNFLPYLMASYAITCTSEQHKGWFWGNGICCNFSFKTCGSSTVNYLHIQCFITSLAFLSFWLLYLALNTD